MSNEIDSYKHAKDRLRRFLDWRGLIGKEYFGGTRGKGGEFGHVCSASCAFTIYRQEYDGATNYHYADTPLQEEFANAAILNSNLILDSVQKQLEDKVEEAKKLAEKIAREILE